ncbi:MAG: TPM domain-containing protein [Chitinophagaceae bacterium]|nr:TPM domain-containing protein [Chitinophagaceae bacterium]
MKKYLLIFFTLLLGCLYNLKAQDNSIDKIISTPPSPQKLVNDYAGILTADQKATLEEKLLQFDKSTSTQITVVLVPALDGMDIADAATELGRKWGVGQQKNNNGVVLLVSLKDRKLNISPGYGLEKSLPDITCQQIIDGVIKPKFKGQDYYRGLDEGTDAIIQATQGAFTAPQGYNKKKGKGSGAGAILAIIIIIIILSSISRGGGGSFMSRRGYRGFNGPFIFPGGWGGGGSGGGDSGGGGFGGFGGGSFGGGGASGDW